jgi:hypothetical protein
VKEFLEELVDFVLIRHGDLEQKDKHPKIVMNLDYQELLLVAILIHVDIYLRICLQSRVFGMVSDLRLSETQAGERTRMLWKDWN